MNVDVTLPRLVGTRQSADELFAAAFAGVDDAGTLVLRARAVLNAAPSFVDEIVKLASDRSVERIELVGESAELRHQFMEAAKRRGGKVQIVSAVLT